MNKLPQLPAWADSALSIEIPRLCELGEGQALEFKRILPVQGHEIGKEIAAFASSNFGRILCGVTDEGDVIGLPEAFTTEGRDEIQKRLFNLAKEVKPPVHPRLAWAIHDSKVVCVLSIEKGVEAIYYSNQRPIIRRGSISRPAEAGEVEQIFRDRYSIGSLATPLPSTQKIAARMNSVLSLMNVDRYEPLTVADLARALNLPSPADLDTFITGRSAATFQMIDQFCARFAVNKEWLATGRDVPFSSPIEHYVSPEECIDLLTEIKPSCVYLVRSISEEGETFIVVENDRYKFFCLPAVWHVSGRVGGGGSLDLLRLYKLFSRWATPMSSFGYRVYGREVTPEVAHELLTGSAFPGIVAEMQLSYWWEDLTDLEYKWTKQAVSQDAYGENFIDAQEIIRKMLSREALSN